MLVSSRATIGRVALAKIPLTTNQGFKNIIIRDAQKALPEFLAYMMKRLTPEMERMASGGTFKEISKSAIAMLKIPLPSLEVQHQIVAEIEGYQKIIDGAQQVLDNYKPHIAISPDWPVVSVADVCTLSSGGTPSKANPAYWEGSMPWVSAKDMKADRLTDALLHVSDAAVGEQRFLTLGMDALGRILVMCHTQRDGRTRIISARKASKSEVKKYHA